MAQIRNFGFESLFQELKRTERIIPEYRQCNLAGQARFYVVRYERRTEPL